MWYHPGATHPDCHLLPPGCNIRRLPYVGTDSEIPPLFSPRVTSRLLGERVVIDRVSSTYSLMESSIDLPALILDLASQLCGHFRGHSSKLVGKRKTVLHGSHRKDFWRLLASDIGTSRHDVMEWRRARVSDWKVCLSEYRNGVLDHGVRGKMPFSTEKRYVGLGPAEMRVGDVVVVLYGGRFPFVLRPTVDQKYNLVGYAYVSVIMDGEAVSAFKKTQTFQIV